MAAAIIEEMQNRNTHQDPFISLVEQLRCYGDGCPFPLDVEPGKRPRRPAVEEYLDSHPAEEKKVYDKSERMLRRKCAKLLLTPQTEEFAVAMFHHFFKPIELPRIFGREHKAGINACMYLASVEHKFGLDEAGFCAALDVTDAKGFRWALRWVRRSYTTFRDRYSKRKIYARAIKKAKVFRHDRDSWKARQVCGRDVTGQLRAEIFILGRQEG